MAGRGLHPSWPQRRAAERLVCLHGPARGTARGLSSQRWRSRRRCEGHLKQVVEVEACKGRATPEVTMLAGLVVS